MYAYIINRRQTDILTRSFKAEFKNIIPISNLIFDDKLCFSLYLLYFCIQHNSRRKFLLCGMNHIYQPYVMIMTDHRQTIHIRASILRPDITQIPMMEYPEIHNCAELTAFVDEIGFLPLLSSDVNGWSAEEIVDEDCQYTPLPEGGWEWPLWEWKGSVIQESGCAYGKFFKGKAAFISRKWWPDFCNWRRYARPKPSPGSIEEAILLTLQEHGSMITRDLRTACGFTGRNMRSRFDSFITKLQMAGYIVTEDFVYPHDKHGRQYGWGLALLTTPEQLFGSESCRVKRSPQASRMRIFSHFKTILPGETTASLDKIIE